MTGSGASPAVAVVLNYRTPEATIRAARSAETSYPPLAGCIVVDNASADGSVERIRRELPHVELIVAQCNLGFSGGCNLGIRAALDRGAASVLLLNSDAVLTPGAVERMVDVFEGDLSTGIVGPMLRSGHTIQSLGIVYSHATGRMRHRGHGTVAADGGESSPLEVDGVSGAAMLVRREVFARVGLLAEEFFFGFEDLDFCLRARDAGFRTICARSAVVEHEGSATIGRRSTRLIYFGTRNHLLLAWRRSQARGRRPSWLQTMSILGLNFAHALFTADSRGLGGVRAFVRGARDHFAGKYGPGEETEQT
jgi:GT2 family glycosyltransferase